MGKVAAIGRDGRLMVNAQHASHSTTQYARGYVSEGAVATDDLVVYLDAADYTSFPGERSLAGAFGDYGSNQVHYDVVGDDGVILLGTSTSYVGRFASTIASSGDHTVMFDYWSDNDSVNFYIDNDGVDNNEFNATITANKKKATYSQTQNMSTTGSSTMYLKTTSTGSKVYISNFRFFRNGTSWNDISGSGSNAAITNATFGTSSGGAYFNFDGDGDYMILDDSNGNLFANDTDFTIEIWAVKDTDNANSAPMLMHYRGGANYPSFGLIAYGTSGNFSDYGWTMEADTDQDGDGSGYASLFADRNNSIDPDGEWGLFTVTYSGSSGSHAGGVYFNGSFISQDTGSASQVWKKPTSPYNGGPTIGSSAHSVGNTTHGFEGKMAIIRIYRKALSAAQIKQNFNAERNRFGV